MEKLSRTARFKELRDNLDNESPENFSRSPRPSQTSPSSVQEEVTVSESETSDGQSFVFKELEKEVRAYNQKQTSSFEDTTQNEAKRQSHLEPMDLNAPAGDVTTNISTVDLNSFSAPSTQSRPTYSRMNILADEEVEEDNLEVFDLGVDDFDRTIQQKKTKSSSAPKQNRKSRKSDQKVQSAPKTSVVEDDEEEERSFSWLTLFLGLAIVVLIGSIAFMIYLIIQSGII